MKFADEIIKEIKNRKIDTNGCVTGEEFERWLKENKKEKKIVCIFLKNVNLGKENRISKYDFLF